MFEAVNTGLPPRRWLVPAVCIALCLALLGGISFWAVNGLAALLSSADTFPPEGGSLGRLLRLLAQHRRAAGAQLRVVAVGADGRVVVPAPGALGGVGQLDGHHLIR